MQTIESAMNSANNYLRDVFYELLDRGRRAKADAVKYRKRGGPDSAFADGRAQGYYEVLSHMVMQLDAFGIDRSSVGLAAELNLERELL
jgi:hypothetical protein